MSVAVLRVAVIGSGPAGLMAATDLARGQPAAQVTLFERRPGLGRKLLVAGASGLNISHHLESLEAFASHYEGAPAGGWIPILKNFGPQQWLQFIESELGLETFLGTSSRYFVREMKAANLLKKWTRTLESLGVVIRASNECTGLKRSPTHIEVQGEPFDHVVLAMGGGSWEEKAPEWPRWVTELGVRFTPWQSANCGYEVDWPKALLNEAEGKPLKRVKFKTPQGEKLGELVITSYGLEGTPVYFLGQSGLASIDLKPDLDSDRITELLLAPGGKKIAPIRRAQKDLGLSEGSCALLFHFSTPEERQSARLLSAKIKNLEIRLGEPRPLTEAISSRGGVSLDDLDAALRIKAEPRISCVGEMLDWHAPTGGFLIQGAVSTGAWAARAILSARA